MIAVYDIIRSLERYIYEWQLVSSCREIKQRVKNIRLQESKLKGRFTDIIVNNNNNNILLFKTEMYTN